jgi:hypothetical protein
MKMEITVTIEQTFDGAMIKVRTPQCDWIKQHSTSEDAIAEAAKLGLVTKRIASVLVNRGNRFLGEILKIDDEALSKTDSRSSTPKAPRGPSIDVYVRHSDDLHNAPTWWTPSTIFGVSCDARRISPAEGIPHASFNELEDVLRIIECQLSATVTVQTRGIAKRSWWSLHQFACWAFQTSCQAWNSLGLIW